LRERIEKLERETAYFQSTDYAAPLVLKNQNVGVRHTEYEGENETPLGQLLDGQGDEVEP
jgi:hypothetical protein